MSSVVHDLVRFGPERCDPVSPQEAAAYTRCLAESHPENFHVISRLLPVGLRADFASVYAFCRWADDLADETPDPQRALALLDWWSDELSRFYAGRPRHPVFIALGPTIERHELPRQLFEDLIDAFRQDQRTNRYHTWAQLLDYCRRSANPVGRMVLMMCGEREERQLDLADLTCTALQLANHWQDVRRDILDRNRIYIPMEVAGQHGLDLESMAEFVRLNESRMPALELAAVPARFGLVLGELVRRTEPLFARGRALWDMVGADVRPVLRLFTFGGEAILRDRKSVV